MSATPQTEPGTRLLHVLRLTAGTPVLTLRGIVPADGLRQGDRLIARSGAIRLDRIDLEVLHDAAMLRIGAGTMAHGSPGEDLLLPPDQPLLLRGERAGLVYGSDPVTVPAGRIADGRLNRIVRVAQVRLVTLGFAAPAAIYAGELQPVTHPETACACA